MDLRGFILETIAGVCWTGFTASRAAQLPLQKLNFT